MPLGRDEDKVKHIKKYLQAVGMFRDFSDSSQDPDFAQVWERLSPNMCFLFLETVVLVVNVCSWGGGCACRKLYTAKLSQKNRMLKAEKSKR